MKINLQTKRRRTENALIVDVLDGVPEADRKRHDQNVKIKEKGEPSGRLVLRHWGDDGDMNLGITSVPQGVEPDWKEFG